MTTLHDNVGIASYVHASLRLDPTDSVVLVLCTNGMALGTLRIDAHPETEASEFASSVIRILTSISEPIDATVLVSYEGDKAMTFAQYDELSQRLDSAGAPVAKAVLVTNGQIMDYHGDSTDAVDYAEVYTNPFTLEVMLATGPTRGLRKIGTEIHANDIPVSILAWIGLAKKRNARRKAFAVWGNG